MSFFLCLLSKTNLRGYYVTAISEEKMDLVVNALKKQIDKHFNNKPKERHKNNSGC
jgi:hypothetical protein